MFLRDYIKRTPLPSPVCVTAKDTMEVTGTTGQRSPGCIYSVNPTQGQVHCVNCQKPVLKLVQVWGPTGDPGPRPSSRSPTPAGRAGKVLLSSYICRSMCASLPVARSCLLNLPMTPPLAQRGRSVRSLGLRSGPAARQGW